MIKRKDSIILIIIQRTLSFPFFLGVALVGASMIFIKWMINFIRFGGESIAYTSKTNRKTILDVFEKVQQQTQEIQELKTKENEEN